MSVKLKMHQDDDEEMMFNGRKSSKRTKQTTVKGPWGKDEDDVVIRLVYSCIPLLWSVSG